MPKRHPEPEVAEREIVDRCRPVLPASAKTAQPVGRWVPIVSITVHVSGRSVSGVGDSRSAAGGAAGAAPMCRSDSRRRRSGRYTEMCSVTADMQGRHAPCTIGVAAAARSSRPRGPSATCSSPAPATGQLRWCLMRRRMTHHPGHPAHRPVAPTSRPPGGRRPSPPTRWRGRRSVPESRARMPPRLPRCRRGPRRRPVR